MTGALSRYPEPGGSSTQRASAKRRQRETLGEALGHSPNSLNALRVIFAAAVIVSHSWWIGNLGPEPAFYGIKLGTAGVMGFFAISGYLITLSAQRASSARDYFAARFIRIYPGLAVATFSIALIVAPFTAVITGGRYDLGGALAFVGTALTLMKGLTSALVIGTSLQGNRDDVEWNGPLWTLTWEVVCYVVVAAIVFALRRTGRQRREAPITVVLFAAITIIAFGQTFTTGFSSDRNAFVLPLIAVFLAGSLLAHYRERVHIGVLPAFLAAELAWAAFATGLGPALAPLPFAYLVLCAGSLRAFSRVGTRFDVSYGVYIYGWPVQQLLAAAHVPWLLGPFGYAGVSLLAVWPLAFLSCVLIEQPAQRWRRPWARRNRKQPEPAAR